MTVTIDAILYDDGRSQSIFRATDETGQAARYKASNVLPRAPAVGECWALEFTDERHPKYGAQRCVSKGSLRQPAGAFLVHLLSRHPALRGLGIGVVTANKLYRTHGPGLASLMSAGDSAALPELDEDTAYALCERWRALSMEPAVVTWLDSRGLEPRIAAKILALYGAQAVDAMETNPYCLLPFLSFSKIDAFALSRLGIARDDPRRLVAATEDVLYKAIAQGHTASSRTSVIEGLRWTVGDNAEVALDLTLQQDVAFADGPVIQAYAPAFMERALEKWLRETRPDSGQGDLILLGEEASVYDLLERLSRAEHAQLTEEQRAAVLGALRSRVYCIVGGAGVGKTTVLQLLGRLIVALHGQAHYMAISGRASRRIAEALGKDLAEKCTVKTVAAYVRSVAPTLAPESAPWVIVDEASMLDLQSAYRIVTRSPTGARIVLVGDPHQLPPVGAGLFFHRLVESPDVPRTELTRVFRQTEATGIPAVARAVRAGQFPILSLFDGVREGVQFQPASTADVIAEAVRVRDVLAQMGDVQVLTLFRTTQGAGEVNRVMHARVQSSAPRLFSPLEAAVGEPVMFAKNDPELGLQNGSVGTVIGADPDAKILKVKWDDGEVRDLSGPALYHCELAHGVTTHKSQGSQYERVVIVVPRASKILDRTLLYTAITRAKTQAVLVGDLEAIREAVTAASNATRRNINFLSPELSPREPNLRRVSNPTENNPTQ
jgi:exodeoxyribonuclease V alpha subunit